MSTRVLLIFAMLVSALSLVPNESMADARDKAHLAEAVAESKAGDYLVRSAANRIAKNELKYDVIPPSSSADDLERIGRAAEHHSRILAEEVAFLKPVLRRTVRDFAVARYSEPELLEILGTRDFQSSELTKRFLREGQEVLRPIAKQAAAHAASRWNSEVTSPYD